MPTIYNIETVKTNLEATQGDTILFSFNVTLNDVAFDMTGYQARMQVRRKDGLLIKDWMSYVSPADITITADLLEFNTAGFTDYGIFNYDLQVTTPAGTVMTLMAGEFVVKKQFTP
jgi:hypothetical protein